MKYNYTGTWFSYDRGEQDNHYYGSLSCISPHHPLHLHSEVLYLTEHYFIRYLHLKIILNIIFLHLVCLLLIHTASSAKTINIRCHNQNCIMHHTLSAADIAIIFICYQLLTARCISYVFIADSTLFSLLCTCYLLLTALCLLFVIANRLFLICYNRKLLHVLSAAESSLTLHILWHTSCVKGAACCMGRAIITFFHSEGRLSD